MDIDRLIRDIKASGRTTLTEAESKTVLHPYGVPVVQEWVVRTAGEAAGQAEKIGYPVVLKGLGARLTHKTERGLVKLNLEDAGAVLRAAGEIAAGAGADLEGFLLQPLVTGRREFVAGLFRDAQFGPVIMFGLGGIFTEALDDVVFRLAPLDEAAARQMVGELRSHKLLAAFRGEKPADMEGLSRALMGLSRLGCEHPDIREVDINPLVVDPEGRVVAVDALIILEEHASLAPQHKPPVAPMDVAGAFYPRSVAFIGATENIGKWGFRMFTSVVAGQYEGQIHLVNPKGGMIAGRRAYGSLAEIPGSVDLAVVTVPADKVIALLPAMQSKGIKYMLLISSGFGETGPEGRRLEQDLITAARQAGVLILGPNTMGICNPHLRLYCTGAIARPIPGSMAFISQSGNMGAQLLAFAEQEGMGIRAFGGSGNEAMVTIEDYLEAFAVDTLTQTVVLYIESVKNGRRFYEAARRVGRQKPIIVLKGGRTQEGNKAAASHTGALAANNRVFEAACRQAGVTVVKQPMDLLDVSACFSSLPLPRGKRIGIMTLGGGWGVVATDLCIEQGLEIPALPAEMIHRIDRILPSYWSRSNPVDLVGDADLTVPIRVMEELMRWDGCDACIHMGIMGLRIVTQRLLEAAMTALPGSDRASWESLQQAFRAEEAKYMESLVRLMERYGKPILGAYLQCDGESRTITDPVAGSPFKGVVFRTPEQAVKALSKMSAYDRWLDLEGVPVEKRGIRIKK